MLRCESIKSVNWVRKFWLILGKSRIYIFSCVVLSSLRRTSIVCPENSQCLLNVVTIHQYKLFQSNKWHFSIGDYYIQHLMLQIGSRHRPSRSRCPAPAASIWPSWIYSSKGELPLIEIFINGENQLKLLFNNLQFAVIKKHKFGYSTLSFKNLYLSLNKTGC